MLYILAEWQQDEAGAMWMRARANWHRIRTTHYVLEFFLQYRVGSYGVRDAGMPIT